MRRPRRRDTVSTSRRAASRRPSLTPTARATPVGARYSPNTERRVSVHSPVVMPACAQTIEAGMMLRSSLAAAASSSRAFFTAALSREARHACRRSICPRSTEASTVRMAPSPVDSGEGSASV